MAINIHEETDKIVFTYLDNAGKTKARQALADFARRVAEEQKNKISERDVRVQRCGSEPSESNPSHRNNRVRSNNGNTRISLR